jgi:DNA mismatch repair protein MutL
MKDIIQLLPDFLANQIAAGEVVQRPASVVKELMENAIDAGANSVQLLIKEAGKILIQVIDNGNGMSETDARMSFERHATSKIKTTEDLFNIRTMGFRGEALASIAAVAQVEMKSRRQLDELGTWLKIEGSEVKSQENIQCVVGTSISVKNLFFNVPARRNFLKSNAVEMRHIIDEFHRIALSYPEKNFSLVHNDTEIYKLTAGKLSHRIVAMFGKNYREQLAPCHEETAFVSIQGYVGKPEFSKKTRGEQFFFVNNRYIRHNYLHHAVMSAYENLVPEGCFPFYVLFIEISPVHIDINVHPTKTEIKFDDERAVYAIVAAAVRKALGTNNMVPSLDFEMNVNFDEILLPKTPKNTHYNNSRDYPHESGLEKSNLTHWTKLYQDFQDAFLKENGQAVQISDNESVEELTFASKINTLVANENLVEEQDYKKIFSLHNRFLMLPVRAGLLLIDRQLAHERILYERFMDRLKKQVSSSQTLLFPVGIELNSSDFALLEEISSEIHHLGFGWNVLGKNTIALHSVPAEINSGTEKDMLEALIEQFKWNQSHLQIDVSENVVQALAKRSSVKPGSLFSSLENTALIEQLFVCQNPNYTPEGKPVFVKITLEKLADFFN